ncbi:MAG: choice-of-anchor D domain-containing protein [bacterium]|nr:choice-of-anchor D domain-containing protein [bacterium]
MAAIQNQYGLAKLRVIAVGMLLTPSSLKSYARDNSALFLADASVSASTPYNINGTLPVNYVIKPDGKVYNGTTGFDEAQIKSWIDSCIGSVAVDDTVQTMTITNNGDTDLIVTNITKSNSWIVSVSPTSFTLAPDSSQNVTVTVTRNGLSYGTYYGSLDISSNDTAHTPYIEPVKLVVQKTAPDISVTEDILKFTWGESEDYDTVKTMTVRNDGNVNLNVTNITKSDSWIVSVNPTSFTITPGDSQSVTVVVTRDGLACGTHYGSLNIVSDDPDENPTLNR